ncbi:MAG: FprA family A-type flavoprotein [Syntrophomonadaceae bacterium]|jgi:flavorubredoxin|nr:FprA family A-type flavoprotein [Syntrophomonadaceae bacterium]
MKKLTESVYYTGVLNPGMRVFDVIMRTEYGTSYNSYVVKGAEKTAVIEAAHLQFATQFEDELHEALGDTVPDYLVLNHTEPDHSGCVARLTERYPQLILVVSPAAAIYIKKITNRADLNLQIVRDGDTLDLGGKTLRFINAPLLHWPDSMFTWLEEENILFSCDFLGCHFCEPAVYDHQITYYDKYWEAVQYYYACIFGPFAPYVQKGLEKTASLDIKMVCPSHGPVLTAASQIRPVMDYYREQSSPPQRSHKLIPLFYCTAYGNTKLIAEAVRRGILNVYPDADAEAYNIIEHDMAGLASIMNGSDAFLIGALTINREAAPPVWQLLSYIDAVNIPKRPVALFGSFGWSGEAFPHIAERLASVKCAVFERQFKLNFVPTGEDLEAAEAFGEQFARTL